MTLQGITPETDAAEFKATHETARPTALGAAIANAIWILAMKRLSKLLLVVGLALGHVFLPAHAIDEPFAFDNLVVYTNVPEPGTVCAVFACGAMLIMRRAVRD